MDISKIERMLAQLRAGAALAAGKAPVQRDSRGTESNATGGVDFTEVLKNSLDQVNSSQQHAAKLARVSTGRARGEPDRSNDFAAKGFYLISIYRPSTQQTCLRISGHHEYAGYDGEASLPLSSGRLSPADLFQATRALTISSLITS